MSLVYVFVFQNWHLCVPERCQHHCCCWLLSYINFFSTGNVGCFHSMLWHMLPGGYWWIHVSSPVWMLNCRRCDCCTGLYSLHNLSIDCIEKTVSSVVASLSVMEMCLPHHFLPMAKCIHSTVSSFSCHGTVCKCFSFFRK
jgi:hypothetical protein